MDQIQPLQAIDSLNDLLLRAKRGDSKALREFLSHPDFQRRSSRICQKIYLLYPRKILDWQGLRQDLCVRVLEKFELFNGSTLERFFGWLYWTATYMHFDALRHDLIEEGYTPLPRRSAPASAIAMRNEAKAELKRRIASLSANERELLKLASRGSLREIAPTLQISKSQAARDLKDVRARLDEIRQMLIEALSEYQDEIIESEGEEDEA